MLGRTCVGAAALAAFALEAGTTLGPLLPFYKQVVQTYSRGGERPLAPEVERLAREALALSPLDEAERRTVRFFHVVGHEPVHAGTPGTRWGALVGAPATFEARIDLGALRVGGAAAADWAVDARDLLDALALSEDARRFALLRELLMLGRRAEALLDGALAALLAVALPARVARGAALGARLVAHALGFAMYRGCRCPFRHLAEREADARAAGADPRLLAGGIEFYEKTLRKHRALRLRMGRTGRWLYDASGDLNYVVFAPRLPLSTRLRLLREMRDAGAP